ncbi:MAG: hypothetical protein RQ847_00645 [Wenzhouxiangellaceae bacterium]|nr:hypothetical protein [Wenzhouxiangellaceae bacterium]
MKIPLEIRYLRRTGPALSAAMLLGLTLAGCTDETGDPPAGHVLDAQQQALERARAVEDEVQDAARRQAERIEEAEGGAR